MEEEIVIPFKPTSQGLFKPIWVQEKEQRDKEEEMQYQKETNTPYYKTYKKPTKKQWRQQKKSQQQKVEGINNSINKSEDVNPVSNAVNQYFRELNYRTQNGYALPLKYTLPASAMIAGGLMNIPATATSLIGGKVGGDMFDYGSKLVSGKTWAENIHNWTGLDIEPAQLTNPGTLVGMGKGFQYGNKGVKYAGKVKDRYKFANQKLSTPEEITKSVKDLGYTYDKDFEAYSSHPIFSTIKGNTVTKNGQILVRPGNTTELHINPRAIGDIPTKSIRLEPESGLNIQAVKLLKSLPSGSVLSSDNAALSIPQIIQKRPLVSRINYYLTGRTSQSEKIPVDGYSTDIMQLFKTKNIGQVIPSLTTELQSFNISGKNFNKFSKYFDYADENGNVLFKDMTPEQVESWNNEVAPLYNHYIDPIKRTAQHLMLITK